MSPILGKIIKQNAPANPVINLKAVAYKDLQNVINYIYQGEVSISPDDLDTFLEVAEGLQIEGISGVMGSKTIETEVQASVQPKICMASLSPPRKILKHNIIQNEYEESHENKNVELPNRDEKILPLNERKYFTCG